MRTISQADLRRLLEALPELYAQMEPLFLARKFVEVVARLIPCDIVNFDQIDRRSSCFQSVHNCPLRDAERAFPAFMAHIGDHPRLTHLAETGDQSALKISDFVPSSSFESTALYNEFYRVFGIRYQLSCFLDSRKPLELGIGLQRLRTDFKERDRAILNLLRPHFSRAWQNAQILTRMHQQTQGLRELVGRLRLGIISLNGEQRIEWASEQALALLAENLVGDRITSSNLPALIDGWLRHQIGTAQNQLRMEPRAPLKVPCSSGHLVVHWLPQGAERSWLVLVPDYPRPSLPTLERLGLTGREAEVLSWILEGKTNPEISIILACSANTVRKHVEHILVKLGVETRGAAASRTRELLRDGLIV